MAKSKLHRAFSMDFTGRRVARWRDLARSLVFGALLAVGAPLMPTEANAGTIIIVKTTIGLDGTFDFSGSAGIGNFSILTIGNTGVATFVGLNAGVYVISETTIQGFRLSTSTCVSLGLGSTINLLSGSLSIDLGLLDTVTCTMVSVSDPTAPSVASFTRQSPAASPTNADTLIFRATFSEDVQSVDAADFAVDGTTTASVTAVAAVSATQYDVTISGGDLPTFNGTVGLNLAAGATITDLANNPLPTTEPPIDEVYDLNNAAPSVASFARQSPATSPTNADTLVFRATFSEDVQSVDAADFAVDGTTTASVTAVAAVSANQYDVTISGGDLPTFNGTVGLNLAAGATITDLANNPLPASEPPIDEVYDLNNAAPYVASFTRQSPAASPTNADTLIFRATFSEDVQSVDAADFAVDGTTTASVTAVAAVSATQYDVTISGGDLPTFNGTVGLNLAAGATITDLANNPLPATEPPIDEVYDLNNAAPSAALNAPASIATLIPFNVGVTFSDAMSGLEVSDFEIDNGTATALSGSGNSFVLSIMPSGPNDISVLLPANSATNSIGNGNATSPTAVIALALPGTVTIEKVVTSADGAQGTFTYTSTSPQLTGLTLSTSAGTASATIALPPGSHSISENQSLSWQLTSVTCVETGIQNSTTNPTQREALLNIEPGESVTCTFASDRDSTYVQERTKRIISNFLARRSDQMTASDPDLVGRLVDRQRSRGNNGVPLTAMGSDDGENAEVQFHRAGLSARQWGLWTEGRWSTLHSPETDGDLGLAYLGIDYAFSPNFVAGILIQFDYAASKNKIADYEISGAGWLAGPYAIARIGTNVILDARLAWGTSQNDISPLGTYEDTFSTERVLARLRLTGDFTIGNWQIQPHAGALFFEEKQEFYSDSLGNHINGQTVSLGRMTFGPKFRTNIIIPGGVLQPFAAIHGIWDFKREHLVDVDTGQNTDAHDVHARINAGFAIQMISDTRLTIDGTIDGVGSGLDSNFGLSAQFYVPLN